MQALHSPRYFDLSQRRSPMLLPSFLNLFFSCFFSMSYNIYRVWGFRPAPLLESLNHACDCCQQRSNRCCNFANVVELDSALFFFLLISSPPFDVLIILYGTPHIKNFLKFLYSPSRTLSAHRQFSDFHVITRICTPSFLMHVFICVNIYSKRRRHEGQRTHRTIKVHRLRIR